MHGLRRAAIDNASARACAAHLAASLGFPCCISTPEQPLEHISSPLIMAGSSPALTLAQTMASASNSPHCVLRCLTGILAGRWGAHKGIHNPRNDLTDCQAGHSAQQGPDTPLPGSTEGARCRHGDSRSRLRQQGKPCFRGRNNDRHARQRPLWAGADAGFALIT